MKLQKYEKNHLVMQQLASEINDLFKENHSKLKTDPKVQLVRTISYQKFADQNRVWLEVPDYNSSRVYGLTYKELVAGIHYCYRNTCKGGHNHLPGLNTLMHSFYLFGLLF